MIADLRGYWLIITESGKGWIGTLEPHQVENARNGGVVRLRNAYRYETALAQTPQGMGWIRMVSTIEQACGCAELPITEVEAKAAALQDLSQLDSNGAAEMLKMLRSADDSRAATRAAKAGIFLTGAMPAQRSQS